MVQIFTLLYKELQQFTAKTKIISESVTYQINKLSLTFDLDSTRACIFG